MTIFDFHASIKYMPNAHTRPSFEFPYLKTFEKRPGLHNELYCLFVVGGQSFWMIFESNICYAFWVKIPLFSSSSVFLIVPNPPSGDGKFLLSTPPPCHTSKVASWHVDWRYELHLWSCLSKIWPKVSKTCDISCFLQFCQILPLFETLSQILLREGHKWSSYPQCQDATFDAWQGGIL